MEHLPIKLDDLPDEILIIILKKLSNVEVLYSLIGINKRLNRIGCDSVFTSNLTLYFLDKYIHSLSDSMVNRFCSQILPEIDHKIKWLNLESKFMERILLAGNYPNLYGLGLYGIDVEKAISLFTEYLNFGPSLMWHQRFSFDMPSPNVISSSLLELHITVFHFYDLLYLLDGRFNQLRRFHVNIYRIQHGSSNIYRQEKLPNLRCFSLYSDMRVHYYDQFIPPLLHRMLNLEELDLHLKVDRYKGFIDGNDLKENIINNMPRLIQFTFNIRLTNRRPNQTNLPSNEDIKHTFKDFKDNQIISCADFFEENQFSYCHIYSYSYRMKYYDNITNNFPGGLFKYVDNVSLFDERPFEYEFFLQIAQSFPFMKKLTINNNKPQKNKLYKQSKKDNQDLPIIKYLHLTNLYFDQAHDDYIEQFLIDTETYLPYKFYLFVDYEALKRVTENFSRHATRINCAKVHYLCLPNGPEITEHMKDYFPQINIG
ncbi:unnamed protein product [Rotaria sordida]|uniref:F-box domain-containing protein n=1 Tax=Rotaria sordida TaxID=392033 RepID=A0A818JEF6_9BILA|nr:unnamed protein product [Rotaria sordida]